MSSQNKFINCTPVFVQHRLLQEQNSNQQSQNLIMSLVNQQKNILEANGGHYRQPY